MDESPEITRAALIAGAYLIGAIPFGLLIAIRFAKIDVRRTGSGNIGATNVARSAGKKLGIVTLFLDGLKGAAPVLVAERAFDQPPEIVAGVGLAAVLGHVFPIYLKLRGGKGVATAAGVFLAFTPVATAVSALVFGVLFAAFRVVSVGSLGAAIALVAAVVWIDGRPAAIALAAAVTLLIIARHRGNIERLLKREENRI